MFHQSPIHLIGNKFKSMIKSSAFEKYSLCKWWQLSSWLWCRYQLLRWCWILASRISILKDVQYLSFLYFHVSGMLPLSLEIEYRTTYCERVVLRDISLVFVYFWYRNVDNNSKKCLLYCELLFHIWQNKCRVVHSSCWPEHLIALLQGVDR